MRRQNFWGSLGGGGVLCKRLTADDIFFIRLILEKNGSKMGEYTKYLQISRMFITSERSNV
jgi:hypothetical protein